MAKKKSSNQSKNTQENTKTEQHPNQPITTAKSSMDGQSEKLQSLKTLNTFLLKETHERRQQVEALTRSKMVIGAELEKASDESVGLELEKGLLGVYMMTQMSGFGNEVKKMEDLMRESGKGEIEIRVLKKKVSELVDGIEIERRVSSCLTREKDDFERELGVKIAEANGLREKIVKMEESERKMVEGAVNKTMEMENEMGLLKKQKDFVEKELSESVKNCKDLKREFFEEKSVIEEERKKEVAERNKLEKDVMKLNEIMTNLREAEKGLKKKVSDIKKCNADMVESRDRFSMEFSVLEGQKMECEKKIECLIEEKNMNISSIKDLQKELENQKTQIDGIVLEKKEISEECKKQVKKVNILEKIVTSLREAEKGLQDKISDLEMSNADMIESRERFSMEFSVLKDKKMECEKKIEGLLKEKNMNISSIEELQKELENRKMQIDEMVLEKKEISEESNRQVKKVNELEKDLNESNEAVLRLRKVEDGLLKKVSELEKSYAEMVESRDRLSEEIIGLEKEKIVIERNVDLLLGEKSLTLKTLKELEERLDDQARKIVEIVLEKNETEEEKNILVVKVKDLEIKVNDLNEDLLGLEEVEKGLNTKNYKLEISYAEMVEKFNVLQEEKLESAKKIESLLAEIESKVKSLSEDEKKFEDQNRKIEGMVREKMGIEEEKASRENEIVELQKELGKIKDTMVTLQETCKAHVEETNRLEFEISKFRHEISVVTNDRDDAENRFEQEKKNASVILLNVSEMEKKFEECLKEMEVMKYVQEKVTQEKKDLGKHVETLVQEIDNLQKSLESKCDISEWVLTMLKNTAALVNKMKDGNTDENGSVGDFLINEKRSEQGEDVQPYLIEFEAIKNALLIKEKEMNKHLVSMAKEANKKKSFWTLISSATTLLVAASVAYVARGH